MPHQPLGEISGTSNYSDIRGRFELTSNWRSHIVGHAAGGQTSEAISHDLNIPLTTIKNPTYVPR
jgi:hypothetical protein